MCTSLLQNSLLNTEIPLIHLFFGRRPGEPYLLYFENGFLSSKWVHQHFRGFFHQIKLLQQTVRKDVIPAVLRRIRLAGGFQQKTSNLIPEKIEACPGSFNNDTGIYLFTFRYIFTEANGLKLLSQNIVCHWLIDIKRI